MPHLDPSQVTDAMLRLMDAEDRARYDVPALLRARAAASTSTRPRRHIPPEVASLAAVTDALPPAAVGPQGWRARFAEVPPPDGRSWPSEHALQVALLGWLNEQAEENGRFLVARMIFATPNAAKRTRGEAGWSLAEGLKAGVPDLLLLVPRRGFHGLALEMKNGPKEKPRDEQAAWLDWLESQGYFAACARTMSEAQAVFNLYL